MAAKLTWNGEALRRFTHRQAEAGLKAAAAELWRISRRAASTINPRRRVKRQRDTSSQGGGKRGTQYTVYTQSARPGQSPRRRTGAGQRGIVWGFSRAHMAARVGYSRTARHMTMHEMGITYKTGKQRRPTIVPALVKNSARLASIAENAARSVSP